MVLSLTNFSNTIPLTSSSFDYGRRSEELRQKMRFFETAFGMNEQISLTVGDFTSSPCAKFPENTMQIPSWFLFRAEDIPVRFHIANLDDPRMTDPNFLNQMADWMNEKIREAGLTSLCRPADRGVLQHVIKLLRDPSLYEKSRDFIIGHEMAHLAHSLEMDKTSSIQDILETLCFAGIVTGILFLFLAVAFLPFVTVSVTLTIAGVAIAISGISCIAWFNRAAKPPAPSDVEEEKNADLDSVKALKDASGGVYYFETSRQHNLAIRLTNSERRNRIDAQGNNLGDKKHPPLSDRIAYLRQWGNNSPALLRGSS